MSSQFESRGQGRAVLLLIAGIPLTMMLAASWLWYFVVEGDLNLVGAIGTANNGTLVAPPRELQSVVFADDAGRPFRWTDLEPRWTLVVANAGPACDSACERRIWFTRQIHIALGREFNRVRRVFIADHGSATVSMVSPALKPEGWPANFESGTVLEYLSTGHAGLVALDTTPTAFEGLFSELSAKPGLEQEGGWYLVDPAGWVMMRFQDDLDYKAVIADLKFLLKNSGG
ncbi:MAG: hypothetical protein P8O91_03770 [Luminiphilus sp.]|nr:hypothetical protein [Luminiphilus sp.]